MHVCTNVYTYVVKMYGLFYVAILFHCYIFAVESLRSHLV